MILLIEDPTRRGKGLPPHRIAPQGLSVCGQTETPLCRGRDCPPTALFLCLFCRWAEEAPLSRGRDCPPTALLPLFVDDMSLDMSGGNFRGSRGGNRIQLPTTTKMLRLTTQGVYALWSLLEFVRLLFLCWVGVRLSHVSVERGQEVLLSPLDCCGDADAAVVWVGTA